MTNRSKHSASLLPNGTVLVVGGSASFRIDAGEPLLSAEIYDPASGAWTDGGTPNVARCSHTATLLPSGRVLLVNGTLGDASSAELYDCSTPSAADDGPIFTPRIGQTLTLLPDG
jgi:hypothetical protein